MATMRDDRILLAVNPSASFGRTAGTGERVAALLRAAGHEVEVVQTTSMAELTERLQESLRLAPAALVAVGGDGMAHLGVNLLAEGDVPLGLVPSGTGNDLARGLGIPRDDPEAAVAALLAALDGGGRRIDALRIRHSAGDRWALGVLSAGFDAIVNERANRMRRPRGSSRYTLALLRELLGLSARRYRLAVDGTEREIEAMLVSVANNSSIGGGMLIAPGALVDDGELDLFAVSKLGRLSFLRIFPRVFRGEHLGHPAVTLEHVREVRLEAEGIVAYADGERVGALPVDVSIVPRAITILA